MKQIFLSILLAAFFTTPSIAKNNYIIGPTASKQYITRTQQAIEQTERYFKRKWGYEIEAPIKIVLSDSPEFLSKHFKSKIKDCFGFAMYRQMFICTDADAYKSSSFNTLEGQKGLARHEFVHIVQSELTRGRQLDPKWMTEGFAELVSFDLIPSHTRIDRPATLRAWRNHARSDGVKLQQLETRNAMDKYRGSYLHGLFAVMELEKRHGIKSFKAYYEAIGQGMNWRAAFKTAFGQGVEEFYKSFKL